MHLEQISQQLFRLIHLRKPYDCYPGLMPEHCPWKERGRCFYLLTLAADNLQELFVAANVFVNIYETGETTIFADLD